MLRIILSRLGQGLITLLVLVTLTFFLVRLMPGNPYTDEKAVPQHIKEKQMEQGGLDKPAPVQFALYLKNVLHGDLGELFRKPGVQVAEVIRQSFPVSAWLGLMSIGIALMIGLPAGVIAAVKKNGPLDYACLAAAMTGICLPSFVIGPLLAVTAGLNLGVLHVAGWNTPADWILPAFTLGMVNAAYIARLTRGGMLDVLNQDYIRTAKAKGVPGPRIVVRHALRGGLIPAVAFVGPAFAGMISGSFVIETIFQVPGMGQHFINATTDREYSLLQGLVLFYGFLIIAANLLSDLAQMALNPRLRGA
ncbi:ABC transporter permease [Haloferula sargassicola]|uniref:Oligopeptide transport system permease protein OppB n=1 Tax=Haloferula sargassicola TaxID=490096 RepID=A0ABP9UIU0_9BACT